MAKRDLEPFEEWLGKYQRIDAALLSTEELRRGYYEETKELVSKTPDVGQMKLKPIPGEHRYAVAIRDDSGLWLTTWIRRSKKGEFFVVIPRADTDWDPHTSYHLDGTFHSKSFDRKFHYTKKQPLTGTFRGTEHLGAYGGHGASIGAVCDPNAYNGMVEVGPDTLGPRNGSVVIDLVEPGRKPLTWPNVIREEVFTDVVPNVVIRITS